MIIASVALTIRSGIKSILRAAVVCLYLHFQDRSHAERQTNFICFI